MNPFFFDEWLAAGRQAIEATLTDYLPQSSSTPECLGEAMAYGVLGGGKRLRALLCLATAELVDASEKDALIAGSAIEMIHAYSLVHDDLPCMDDDVLRRGKPTCHVQYGEAVALLVGDALLTQAFLVLNDPKTALNENVRTRLSWLLAQAAGSSGMVGGQYLDITSTDQTLSRGALENLHRKKTGALIGVSVQFGLALGQNIDQALWKDLSNFSEILGLLYQIVDDILDVESNTEMLGKTAGKDLLQAKSTYVKLWGLEGAQKERDRLFELAASKLSPYRPKADALYGLLERICYRHA